MYTATLVVTRNGAVVLELPLVFTSDREMFDFDDWISDRLRDMAHWGRSLSESGASAEGPHSVTISGKCLKDGKPFFDLSVSYHTLDEPSVGVILHLMESARQE